MLKLNDLSDWNSIKTQLRKLFLILSLIVNGVNVVFYKINKVIKTQGFLVNLVINYEKNDLNDIFIHGDFLMISCVLKWMTLSCLQISR